MKEPECVKKSPSVGQKLAGRDERTSKSPANGQNSAKLILFARAYEWKILYSK